MTLLLGADGDDKATRVSILTPAVFADVTREDAATADGGIRAFVEPLGDAVACVDVRPEYVVSAGAYVLDSGASGGPAPRVVKAGNDSVLKVGELSCGRLDPDPPCQPNVGAGSRDAIAILSRDGEQLYQVFFSCWKVQPEEQP